MSDAKVLSKTDEAKIAKAVAALDGDEEKARLAHRWCRKAVKQFRGVRKCSMRPGEDGLKDTERDQLLATLVKSDWLEVNRKRLGYTKVGG